MLRNAMCTERHVNLSETLDHKVDLYLTTLNVPPNDGHHGVVIELLNTQLLFMSVSNIVFDRSIH